MAAMADSPSLSTVKPPRVLLYDGHKTWRVLRPNYSYGKPMPYGRREDRRYVEECVVHGDYDEAHRVLHRLESSDG
jgi:hypothetical protein